MPPISLLRGLSPLSRVHNSGCPPRATPESRGITGVAGTDHVDLPESCTRNAG